MSLFKKAKYYFKVRTDTELAKKLEISYSRLKRWKKNNPSKLDEKLSDMGELEKILEVEPPSKNDFQTLILKAKQYYSFDTSMELAMKLNISASRIYGWKRQSPSKLREKLDKMGVLAEIDAVEILENAKNKFDTLLTQSMYFYKVSSVTKIALKINMAESALRVWEKKGMATRLSNKLNEMGSLEEISKIEIPKQNNFETLLEQAISYFGAINTERFCGHISVSYLALKNWRKNKSTLALLEALHNKGELENVLNFKICKNSDILKEPLNKKSIETLLLKSLGFYKIDTIRELCEILVLNESTLRTWIRENQLNKFKNVLSRNSILDEILKVEEIAIVSVERGEFDVLYRKTLHHYKVATKKELANKLGVHQDVLHSWIYSKSVNELRLQLNRKSVLYEVLDARPPQKDKGEADLLLNSAMRHYGVYTDLELSEKLNIPIHYIYNIRVGNLTEKLMNILDEEGVLGAIFKLRNTGTTHNKDINTLLYKLMLFYELYTSEGLAEKLGINVVTLQNFRTRNSLNRLSELLSLKGIIDNVSKINPEAKRYKKAANLLIEKTKLFYEECSDTVLEVKLKLPKNSITKWRDSISITDLTNKLQQEGTLEKILKLNPTEAKHKNMARNLCLKAMLFYGVDTITSLSSIIGISGYNSYNYKSNNSMFKLKKNLKKRGVFQKIHKLSLNSKNFKDDSKRLSEKAKLYYGSSSLKELSNVLKLNVLTLHKWIKNNYINSLRGVLIKNKDLKKIIAIQAITKENKY